jgi:hypothetical protein
MQISLLPEASSLATGDFIPIVHGASTNKASLNTLVSYLLYTQSINRGVSGNMLISGDLTVTGNFRSSGNAFIGGDAFDVLRVIGQYKQSGDFFVSGHSIVTGNSNVSGNVSLGTTSGNVHRISGQVNVSGDVNLLNRLTVFGPAQIKGDLTAPANLIVGTNGSNSHTFSGPVTFSHAVSIAGIINSFGSDNYYIGNNWVNGNLVITGNETVKGNVVLNTNGSNTTTVQGKQINLSNVYFTQQLFTNGNSELSGNLTVYGNSVFGGISNFSFFSGTVSVLGNEFVKGSTWVGGNLQVTGDISTIGNAYVGGSFSANGFRNSGNSYLGLNPTDSHAFKGDVAISRNATVTGTLGVSGDISCLGTVRDLSSKYVRFSGVSRSIAGASVAAGEIIFNVGVGLVGMFNTGDYISITGATNDIRYNGTHQITRKGTAGGTAALVYTNLSPLPTITPAVGSLTLDCWIPSGGSYDLKSVTRVAAGRYRIAFNHDLPSANFFPTTTIASTEIGNAMLCTFDNHPFYSLRRDTQVNDFGLSTFIHSAGYADSPWVWFKVQPF